MATRNNKSLSLEEELDRRSGTFPNVKNFFGKKRRIKRRFKPEIECGKFSKQKEIRSIALATYERTRANDWPSKLSNLIEKIEEKNKGIGPDKQ